jgi:hypothetical protein
MIHFSSSAPCSVLGENMILNFLFCLGLILNQVNISPLAPEEHFLFLPDFYSFCLTSATVLYISCILE